MGTQDSLVRIEAATLAGGESNQDRYAYGDGWAFVLDGATSFDEVPPVHDGGWYAERLKTALAAQLVAHPQVATTSLVVQAIQQASADHDAATEGPCPTSTIAMARWNRDHIELYVLGDSYAAIVTPAGKVRTLLNDERIENFGAAARLAYRRRLEGSGGFDSVHRRLLVELQVAQQNARNRADGYWIAGDNPEAAMHGRLHRMRREGLRLVLFTDGLTTVQTPHQTCKQIALQHALPVYVAHLGELEAADPDGSRFPRSKLHDDKTLVLIDLSGAE